MAKVSSVQLRPRFWGHESRVLGSGSFVPGSEVPNSMIPVPTSWSPRFWALSPGLSGFRGPSPGILSPRSLGPGVPGPRVLNFHFRLCHKIALFFFHVFT